MKLSKQNITNLRNNGYSWIDCLMKFGRMEPNEQISETQAKERIFWELWDLQRRIA